jgi:transcription factor E2F7/8
MNSRHEKSLGEICLKFLNHFGAKNEERLVNLEDCVSALGIERRRIYDIVNILESFEMIQR